MHKCCSKFRFEHKRIVLPNALKTKNDATLVNLVPKIEK